MEYGCWGEFESVGRVTRGASAGEGAGEGERGSGYRSSPGEVMSNSNSGESGQSAGEEAEGRHCDDLMNVEMRLTG